MPFGILDTEFIDLPPNVDATYLQGLQTRAGVDFPAILQELDSRLGAVNGGVEALVADLITLTDQPYNFDPSYGKFIVEEGSEYTTARPQEVEGQAHMLPLRWWDVALGFTEEGLNSMSRRAIERNMDAAMAGLNDQARKRCLKRLTDSNSWAVDRKTTAVSPGFAGGVTDTNDPNYFSGNYPDGTALPGGFTRYAGVADGTDAVLIAALQAATAEMRRWFPPPYDIITSAAGVARIQALGLAGGFVTVGSPLVRPADTVSIANLDPLSYVGVFGGVARVHAQLNDFTEPVLALYKTFGPLDARNPLAWRYDPLYGNDAFVRSRSAYPLADAIVKRRFDVGVNNRVGAYLIDTAHTTYAAPAITGTGI